MYKSKKISFPLRPLKKDTHSYTYKKLGICRYHTTASYPWGRDAETKILAPTQQGSEFIFMFPPTLGGGGGGDSKLQASEQTFMLPILLRHILLSSVPLPSEAHLLQRPGEGRGKVRFSLGPKEQPSSCQICITSSGLLSTLLYTILSNQTVSKRGYTHWQNLSSNQPCSVDAILLRAYLSAPQSPKQHFIPYWQHL